jgi:predicted metal-dependent phosphoesterase TrpH
MGFRARCLSKTEVNGEDAAKRLGELQNRRATLLESVAECGILLKIDMHVHSCYSADSLITAEELVFYTKKQGLDGVAITDHDRVDGALKMAVETDILIIPGIEVASSEGHIVGLDVKERVPSELSVAETVDRIHSAGGIAVACHPVGIFKGGLGKKHTSSSFDAVEVINSSTIPFAYAVKQSEKIASRLGKPRLAGSDAHYGPEIGCAYTVVDTKPDVDDIIEAITKGLCQPFGNSIPLATRLKRMVESNRRRL